MAAATRTTGPAPQPYPPQPGSPTLTNPDMILPDYDRAPSPIDMDQDRSQSPLMMWKNAHAATSSSELHQLYTIPAPPHLSGTGGPMTPTTPIIYGNGTMLSDIGEVTEVESTPGKPSIARRRDHSPPGDDALRSSPTMGLEAVRKVVQRQKSHDRARRDSIDSNSTITTAQDQPALFADFDDTVSVDDSVFQGDDEDSVAESYVPDEDRQPPSAARHGGLQDGRSSAERRAAAAAASDRQSALLLSQRAEMILENAKRRLTTMEGNLNRARSSLHTSSPSMSSLGSDGPVVSPTLSFRSSGIGGRDSAPSPGHARIGSENTLRIGLPVKVYPQRSASALGTAGGYRQPLTSSRSVDQIRDSARSALARPAPKIFAGHDISLEPLSESEDDASGSRAELDSSDRGSAHLEGFLSPTFGPGHDDVKVVTRSASATQMRGLRDQVNDLKGKISNLRDQARADSLRRRSFQSLRTPSPFTHARVEQWFAEPTAHGSLSPPGGEAEDDQKVVPQQSLRNGALPRAADDANDNAAQTEHERASSDDAPRLEDLSEGPGSQLAGAEQSSILQTQDQGIANVDVGPDHFKPESGRDEDDGGDGDSGDDVSDMLTEDGDYGEYETPGYESESGESAYHDTLQHPISHEDREDAFDYEHFILHSALGTISQQRLARGDRSGSFSSDGSVETTRGPATGDGAPLQGPVDGRGLQRHKSNSSISTVASVATFESFATADEGRRSRDDGRRIADGERPRGQSRVRELASALNSHLGDSASSGDGQSEPVGRGPAGSAELKSSPPVATVLRRPASSAATTTLHRPSVSSLESAGTMRSFPLVSRKKSASVSMTGAAASGVSILSPDRDLRAISNSLMNEAAAVYVQQADDVGYHIGRASPTKKGGSELARTSTPAAMQQLQREDQFLIERLVAGIGRCVLGLGEDGRASPESRMYRRRLDAARRILEGIDSA